MRERTVLRSADSTRTTRWTAIRNGDSENLEHSAINFRKTFTRDFGGKTLELSSAD